MKVIHKLTLKPIVIALFLLQSTTLHASIGLASGEPWTNRFTGQGLTGDHQLGGFADDMLPILGSADSLFYLDGTFAAAQQDAWLAGPGTGVRLLRTIGDRQIIAGAFVFGEYEHTPNHASAWYANPGFELMTNHQEFRIQGYIPLTKRVKGYDTAQASQLPDSILNDTRRDQSQFAFARGHSLYDTSVELADSFGSGLDVEAGQYLPVGLGGWLRAGFYHFDYDNSSSINGVAANLQLFTGKHASIILQDNYDNQNKNKFMLGMQMTFGGPDFTQVQDLSNRMEEPIIRHIATPTYALITPIRHDYIPSGSTVPVSTGNWFFSRTTGTSQGGTITFANCTAENPCYDLTQDIASGIQLVQPAATLMFATGDYPLVANSPIAGNPQAVIMSDGQKVIGRTGPSATLAQWSQVATGTNRPTINGGLFWGDNNNVFAPVVNASGTIENMQITNNNQLIPHTVSGYSTTGASSAAVIAAGATQNLTINNSLLSATNLSTTNDAPAFGLWSFNGTLTANQTKVTARTFGQGAISTDNYNAVGILGQNGLVSFTNGTITTSTTGDYAYSYGIFAATSNLVVTKSNINASTSGTQANSSGVFASTSNATVTSSSEVTAIARGTESDATGVSAVLGDALVSSSQLSATTYGESGVAYGVNVLSSGHTATISGSTINAASTNTNSLAYGIGSDIVTFIGSASSTTATAQALGASAAAIQGASAVNNPNNSTCTTNGNTVTCA